MKLLKLVSLGVQALVALITAGTAAADLPQAREWNFQVYLNDSPIGFHNFRLDPEQDGYQLQTEARFKVKFLFVTAYRYQHQNEETWRNGCLERISARTNDNGAQLEVTGQRASDGFTLAATERQAALSEDCVRSFAYWDLDALQSTRLLNSQTGEYQSVSVTPAGRESIEIGGLQQPADRYRLQAEGVNLDLWYSPEGDWLGLASYLEKGRQLRYERVAS
ncbi:MAG: DUF6134 family protein [Pseudomonadota bacterium]